MTTRLSETDPRAGGTDAPPVPSPRTLQLGARVSLRRALLWLLILAMTPIVLLGMGRSAQQLRRSQATAEAGLSQRALETARWQTEVVRTSKAVLTLLAEHPDVRSGGILCDMALQKVERGFPAYSNVSRVRADGTLACSSTQPMPALAFARQAWWQRAQQAPGVMIVGPVVGQMSKRQVMVVVLPLRSETGAFDGIVSVSIDMDWMQQTLRTGLPGGDALALVLDGGGRVLVGNHSLRFGAFDVDIAPRSVGSISDASGRRWSYAMAPLITGYDGRRALFIAYAMPEARLFSAGWFQAGFSLLLPLFAVLIASLVIWFGTNTLVVRWLRELRTVADAFSNGDYRARAADFNAAPTEFRVLAAAFYKTGAAVERRDTELRAALDRQNLLVREIHHRVKNNLQIIMSLLSLQAGRLETETGRAAMNQTQLRISTLALVHRLLYETGEQARISSQTLLGGVCDLVDKSFGKRPDVEMHCDFTDIALRLDTAIPLCLWLVEAASNARTHAFPAGRAGAVWITLTAAGGQGTLAVVDNGIGLEDQNPAGPPARGLRILGGIAKQLGGTSVVTSVPDVETRLQLTFPIPADEPGAP